jgi:hypothetical protein
MGSNAEEEVGAAQRSHTLRDWVTTLYVTGTGRARTSQARVDEGHMSHIR